MSHGGLAELVEPTAPVAGTAAVLPVAVNPAFYQ